MVKVGSSARATDVRREWGRFNDLVVRRGPQFVQRNRDEWMAISTEHLRGLLASFRLHVRSEAENDGTHVATVDELDLVANGPDEAQALRALADDLIDYAEEYIKDFELYSRSLNRRAHLPYVLNILAQDSVSDVLGLFDAALE